jgi:hypothetical protein
MAMGSATVRANDDPSVALQNICKIVKADDKSLLRKKISKVKKEFTIKFKDYYGDISCSGGSLLRYADVNQSLISLKFMASKLNASTLKASDYLTTLSPEAIAIIKARIE